MTPGGAAPRGPVLLMACGPAGGGAELRAGVRCVKGLSGRGCVCRDATHRDSRHLRALRGHLLAFPGGSREHKQAPWGPRRAWVFILGDTEPSQDPSRNHRSGCRSEGSPQEGGSLGDTGTDGNKEGYEGTKNAFALESGFSPCVLPAYFITATFCPK